MKRALVNEMDVVKLTLKQTSEAMETPCFKDWFSIDSLEYEL